jgi:hypothetical protein
MVNYRKGGKETVPAAKSADLPISIIGDTY